MGQRLVNLLEKLKLSDKKHLYRGRIKDFYITTTQYNANDSWFFDIEFEKPFDIEDFKVFVERLELLPKTVKGIQYIDYHISFEENDYTLVEDYYDFCINRMIKKRPRFTSIIDYEINTFRNRLEVVCPKDATFVTDLLYQLKPELLKIGFDCLLATKFIKDKPSISERIIKQDEKFKNEVLQNMDANIEEITYRNLDNKIVRGKINQIKEIPLNEIELNEYKSMNDKAMFNLEGEIISEEVRKINDTTVLYTYIISDEEDSIYVKKFSREKVEQDFLSQIRVGMHMKCKGVAQYDKYTDDIVVVAHILEYTSRVVPKDTRTDFNPVKRIELHAHSKMSTLDGIDSVSDYVDTVKKWGHTAFAITDKGNVQGYPELFKATKDKSVKPIYGAEFTFINEEDIQIVQNPKDIDIDDTTYVVFDIETTGLSVNYGKIIEIAAVKIKDTQVIEEYSTYVDPQEKLSRFTKRFTSITDNDVSGAPLIDVVIKEFYEFSKGCVFVAHNANFDMGFISKLFKDHGLTNEPLTSIDTIAIARHCFSNELKRFNLKAVSRFFNVELEQHHRAIFDTRATGHVFNRMVAFIKSQGIHNIKDINTLSDQGEGYKHVISKRISLLVKNDKGLRNLFKITSLANTEYFYREARLLKSVLDQNREGILVGTSCFNSHYFEVALNKTYEELYELTKYYDYIELQPLSDFELYSNGEIDVPIEQIKDTYLRIIKVAEELGKKVVAVSDSYHIRKADSVYRDIYIQTPMVGGGLHPLVRYDSIPSQYLRTTNEMLEEFKFLEEDKRVEVVITNTHDINQEIEFVEAFKKDLYAPTDDFLALEGIPSIENKLIKMVSDKAKEMYGSPLPKIVSDRIEKEITSITTNKFSTVYYISHLLVKKSLDEGYLVGSRGSVGSSLVATLMDITEVNPLSPHYVCPSCHFSSFKMTNDEKMKYGIKDEEIKLQSILDQYETGFDLPKETCPVCGEELNKDGHSIPFETFLGFKGDKVPDIDLNFSGDYQPMVHEYIRTIFGQERVSL
jgi:DNA polymerase-3 subunit alpha (Gram-positive type)